jgi:hypothetical protein
MAKIVGKPNAEDVKRVAVAALVAALDDGKEQARKNPRMTGMRAVATGAVLYTAGKAAFSGRRFISERLMNRDEEPEDEGYEDDEDFEDDEEPEEEPVAEEDEDFEEDEDEDLQEEEEPEEEPVAEEDEDFEEDEEPEEERSAASKPPVHPDGEDVDDDLPSRPSKKREPVGRR